jgi:UDP-N-acetylmuramate: L-alanyl-gamma-D-glutamyl-meso-diaminopimelate ligase
MKFFFLGICGTAMGNVALLLRSMGHEVAGADKDVYPPMSDVLRSADVKIYEGYDAERLEALAPDMVVVGNVVTRGNPEVEWLLNTRKIPYCSLPELLKKEVLAERFNIVVSGTHGKTTTTSLAAYLLKELGHNPGYLIGGVPRDLPNGASLGSLNSPFVIEGDEYDSAFFDKRSKFIHYLPSILIINNLEFDHGDIFRDLQDIQRSFGHLLRIVPKNGYVLVNGDDDLINDLLPISWTTVLKVGVGPSNDLRIVDFDEGIQSSTFSLVWKRHEWGRISWQLPGLFNARNAAMAALAVALSLNSGNPSEISLESLSLFQGVKRRQEILYEDDQLIVFEDFAHHPTALKETLTSLRKRYAGHIINACFEPRSNTACRKFHQETFCDSLKKADRIFLGPVFRSELYSESDRLDTTKIATQLKLNGIEANAYQSNDLILKDLEQKIGETEKNLVCFFSNGSFDGITRKFVDRLQELVKV